MRAGRIGVGVVLVLVSALFGMGPSMAEEGQPACLTSFFTKSLHFTGGGMRYWYEEPNGFMSITGIPYNRLGCKNCHVRSCDRCHAKKRGEKLRFSEKTAKSINTCMQCHLREGLTFKFDGKKNRLDVHMAAGLVCSTCHYRTDVHGDGRERISMRHPKAVRASCEECHVDQEMASPEYDPSTASHSAHGGKLDCAACHVSTTMTCYNCHFSSFLKTGKKKGNFIPAKDWLLLINYNGKVTSGNVMTLVYEGKTFIAYVPYFTHSIQSGGRKCSACHANRAVQMIAKGEKVPVMDFRAGKLVAWKGVVPVVPKSLQWVFLDKSKDGWVPLESAAAPKVQFAAYGEPLTPKQLEKLLEPQSP